MKRLIAALGVAALIGTGAAVAVAGPVEAHTGDLIVTASCNTATGQYDVKAVLNISQTGLNGTTKFKVGSSTFEGTPRSEAGLTGGPIASKGAGQIALTSFTLPGTTTGFGPWVYAFTKWTDQYSKGSDGQLTTRLAGNCTVPNKADAVASASSTPATCTVDGSATFAIENATWDDANDVTDGSRTATALAGHTFAGGSKTTTVTYTPVAQATGNQSTDPAAPCYVAPPKVTHPVASLDHQGVCYANGDHSSENVYVTLDNTGSNVPVRFVGNGIDQIVAAGVKDSAEANPIWQNGGGFDVEYFDGETKIGSDHIDLEAFEDCGAAYVVHIQDYNTCTLNAFVLDNTGSNRSVVYDINGQKFTVPAGEAIHTDADGTSLIPNEDGKFVITTDHGETWTFSAKTKQDCTEKPADEVVVSTPHETVTCEADDVLIETATTTTPYIWDAETQTYVLDTDKAVTTVAETHRDKTAAEIKDCAVVVPPTEEPTPPATSVPTPPVTPEPTPSVTPSAPQTTAPAAAPATKVTPQAKKAQVSNTELAYTGSEGLLQGGIAAAILVMAGIGLVVAARKRRTNSDN